MRRYDFEVTVTGTVSVAGEGARKAHDELVAALTNVDIAVTAGQSAGLTVREVRVWPDVALLRIDGADPFSALTQAIRAYRERGE